MAFKIPEERCMRRGRGLHQYWYISASCSDVGMKMDPQRTTDLKLKQRRGSPLRIQRGKSHGKEKSDHTSNRPCYPTSICNHLVQTQAPGSTALGPWGVLYYYSYTYKVPGLTAFSSPITPILRLFQARIFSVHRVRRSIIFSQ
jgi:hypothetical protein